ncbi:MAG TPA: radical SAM family heme chaperone HemW [Methylomirabilota bacterium]
METGELHPLSAAGATSVAPGHVLAETSPTSTTLGFYVHVPFCTRRCHYCSFNTSPLDDPASMRRYLGALGRELDLLGALAWASRVEIGSVFFGGGTPSLLEGDALAGVLARMRRRFSVATGAEITVECNPESVTREKLAAYRAAGVNRLSLGVQSLDDAVLSRIGRLHDARGARAAFDAARAAGHDNVSVDLMYGLPGLDPEAWTRAVEKVLDWEPEHLSAYGLTLDAGSLWGAAGVAGLPPEEHVVEQYWALTRVAAARGFEHYEISNYARPGFRSRHNLTYWRAAEYLAAGPGGCGFVGDVRYSNVKPVARYCAAAEAGTLPVETFERLTDAQRAAEQLILGLRTADGVSSAALAMRAAGNPALTRALADWRAAGRLVDDGDRTRLSEAGFLVSDGLFVDLL